MQNNTRSVLCSFVRARSCARSFILFLGSYVVVSTLNAANITWTPVNEPGVGGAVNTIRVNPSNSNIVVVGGDMLGAAYSTNAGANWTLSQGMKSWECLDATWHPTDPNIVWMGSMGGPYKSTDGGGTWVSKRAGMPTATSGWGFTSPVEVVLFDPNNSSHLLAFGGTHNSWAAGVVATTKFGAVWESTNGGENWSLKTTINPDANGKGSNICSACFSPGSSTILYASAKGSGMYKSTNGGTSWSPINSGLPNSGTGAWRVAIHPTNASILWLGLIAKGGGIYKSVNAGASWTFSATGITCDANYDQMFNVVVSKSNPNVLYGSNVSWSDLYKSTNGGSNWTKILSNTNNPAAPTSLSPQSFWLEVDPANENTLYCNNSVTIYKTSNGGSTWGILSARTGGVSGSWQGTGYSGYVARRAKWNPYNTNHCFLMAMDDGKLMRSTDTANWFMHGSGATDWRGGEDITFGSDGNTMYAHFGQWNDYDGIARSTTAGASWTYVTAVGSGEPGGIYTNPTNTAQVWVLRGGRLYYSSNSGTSWSETNVAGDTNLLNFAADKNNPLTIYISSRSGLFKTTNGSAFTKVGSWEWASHSRLCIDPNDPNKVWVTNFAYNDWHSGVWRYSAGTWTRVRADVTAYDVAVDPTNSARIVYVSNQDPGADISAGTGVWMSEDNGTTWMQQNSGLPMLRGNSIAFRPNSTQLIVGMNGGGFYKGDTSGSVSGDTPMSRTGWTATASHMNSDASKALDSDSLSRWTSGTAMVPAMWFEVDMKANKSFDKLLLDCQGSPGDYPRTFNFYVKVDGGSTFTWVAAGNGSIAKTVLRFPTQNGRYLRVEQSGNSGNWWSIHELQVYAATSSPHPMSSWIPNSFNNGAYATRGIDGSLSTRWDSNAAQTPGMWYDVDMGTSLPIRTITLNCATSTNDYPRGYNVYAKANLADSYTLIASGAGGPVTIINLSAQNGRYIKIEETQTATSGNWWSIHELNVYPQE